MTEGTSQGLFIVVSIVIFGIFVVLAYILFEDTLSPAMASMFETSTEKMDIDMYERYRGKNLFVEGDKLVEGPKDGWSDSHAEIQGREFVHYGDTSPIFDRFGEGTYTISFDLKTTLPGRVRVYPQNGAGTQYTFVGLVDSTSEWERYSVVVDVVEQPYENRGSQKYKSLLAFYGTYGTGVSPTIKNVKIELGAVDGVPEYEKSPITLRYE